MNEKKNSGDLLEQLMSNRQNVTSGGPWPVVMLWTSTVGYADDVLVLANSATGAEMRLK